MLKTRTSLYLFPLLYDIEYFNFIKLNNPEIAGFSLINLFVQDIGKSQISNYQDNDRLFALMNIVEPDNNEFIEFMENIKNHRFYETHYSINSNYLMIVFKINEDASNIVKLFKEGKYSKFPEFYKNHFRPNASIKINSCYNIMTRNVYLKKAIEKDLDVTLDETAELDDIPYERDEVFDISKIE